MLSIRYTHVLCCLELLSRFSTRPSTTIDSKIAAAETLNLEARWADPGYSWLFHKLTAVSQDTRYIKDLPFSFLYFIMVSVCMISDLKVNSRLSIISMLAKIQFACLVRIFS
jgi:hypothetical protein